MGEDFSGKTVLVTGGNSGIGRAAAKLFAAKGASIAITGRNQYKIDAVLSELGGDAIGESVDVTSVSAIDAFAEKTANTFGKIDAVVVSAGGLTVCPFQMMDERLFDDEMTRNFKGAYFTAQSALKHMEKGSVTFLSSAAGEMGLHGTSVYGPAKAALRNLVRVLASELSPDIRVNAISPGPIPTPGMDRLGLPPDQLEAARESFALKVPLGRMGTVDEVAGAVAFLASDQASFITGVDLAVDGGMAQV
ncbi:MAG: SDR family oxidoreductase [Pseudomonadota bacterium]